MARSAFRRMQDVSADIGWRETLRIAPQWLVCRRYLGFAVSLRELELERPMRSEIRVTELQPADLPVLQALDRSMTSREVTRRLDEGQRCTLGWWGRELAHVRWDGAGPVYLPYLGRVLRPDARAQVVVGIYTAPAFRGRGVAGTVMAETARRARAAGVLRWVWLSAWWNTRSLALADQFASRIQGIIGYRGLGPCRWYFASGGIRLEPDGSFRVDDILPSASRTPEGAVLD